MSKKYNAFFFSPGGYGPYSRLEFWGEKLEVEEGSEKYNDNLHEKATEYVFEVDVDYGCYYITRERAEKLFEELKELLEK